MLIAPDDFTGTLTATEAAQAIASGWRSAAPQDDLTLLPLSDGGPGFVTALSAAIDGEIVPVGVRGPLGDTAIGMLLVSDRTAYVESAHGCGLALVPPDRRDPLRASTYGVGQLIGAAIDSGARTIVVGLGGTASTDGGAGMLAALGARARDADGAEVPLDSGGAALATVARVDLTPARARLGDVEIIAASDVEAALLGDEGAARGYAPQKGADPQEVDTLEEALAAIARACQAPSLAESPGAGAAGGLGFGLLLLGARMRSGIEVMREAAGLDAVIADTDLVVTGEGAFDWQSLRGKAVVGVAGAAVEAGRPVLVIAGRVEVGRREYAAVGITEAHAIGGDPSTPAQAAMALAECAAHVARQWSRRG